MQELPKDISSYKSYITPDKLTGGGAIKALSRATQTITSKIKRCSNYIFGTIKRPFTGKKPEWQNNVVIINRLTDITNKINTLFQDQIKDAANPNELMDYSKVNYGDLKNKKINIQLLDNELKKITTFISNNKTDFSQGDQFKLGEIQQLISGIKEESADVIANIDKTIKDERFEPKEVIRLNVKRGWFESKVSQQQKVLDQSKGILKELKNRIEQLQIFKDTITESEAYVQSAIEEMNSVQAQLEALSQDLKSFSQLDFIKLSITNINKKLKEIEKPIRNKLKVLEFNKIDKGVDEIALSIDSIKNLETFQKARQGSNELEKNSVDLIEMIYKAQQEYEFQTNISNVQNRLNSLEGRLQQVLASKIDDFYKEFETEHWNLEEQVNLIAQGFDPDQDKINFYNDQSKKLKSLSETLETFTRENHLLYNLDWKEKKQALQDAINQTIQQVDNLTSKIQ